MHLSKQFATVTGSMHSKVLVLGGGTAGVTVSSQLAHHGIFAGKQDITILEPNNIHSYQPLWTLVGAGIKTLSQASQATETVIPSGAKWIKDTVHSIDPKLNLVKTSQGNDLTYDYLVIATGFKLDFEKIAGLKETLGSNGVSSNYDINTVEYTAQNIKDFKGGNAVFTQPSSNIKCAGAPQKIAYLAEEIFVKNGVRPTSNVSFYSGAGKIFGIDKYGVALTEICKKRNINVHLSQELVEVRGDKKQALFKPTGQSDAQAKVVDFDMLHVTPHMSPLPFITASGLGDALGFVNVDKFTTQHVKYPNVFSLGDTSSLPTSKTAAAVASQSIVTSRNLISAIEGKELTEKYDGYTSCPLITGEGKLILAEFQGYASDLTFSPGYAGKPLETFFFNQALERSSMYYLTADVMPTLYWQAMLKGRWHGPADIRPLTNPRNIN